MKKEPIIVTDKDIKTLSEMVDNSAQLDRVIEYLEKHNLTIELRECGDARSGWKGQNVMLQGRDLSGNGFCYSPNRLMEHIEFYHTYNAMRQSTAYRAYLLRKEIYKGVDKFFER